jgi:hypothetical protein
VAVTLFIITFGKTIREANADKSAPKQASTQITTEKSLVPAPQENYHNSTRMKIKLKEAGISEAAGELFWA